MKRILRLTILLFLISSGILAFSLYKNHQAVTIDFPTISFDKDLVEVSVESSEEELLAGVTANDKTDGDVTDSIVIESISTFMEDGCRLITYSAFDSDFNVVKATRKVSYTDYHSPEFSISEPLTFTVGSSASLFNGIKASDVLDGDITGNILLYEESNFDPSVAGDYPVRYQVSNSAGDMSSLSVTIHIVDKSTYGLPVIELSDYVAYTSKGIEINPKDYIAQALVNGKTFKAENCKFTGVTVSGIVNYEIPGTYHLTLSIKDKEGNRGTAILYVVVKEDGINLIDNDQIGITINGIDTETNPKDSEKDE